MNDKVAHQKSDPSSTWDSEAKVFLKTAGGGRSNHTLRTDYSGLAYFQTHLEETRAWVPDGPSPPSSPTCFQEFPTWLLKQTYQCSERTEPLPLAESAGSLYLLAATHLTPFFGPAQAAALL
jgi:hypothetical protein